MTSAPSSYILEDSASPLVGSTKACTESPQYSTRILMFGFTALVPASDFIAAAAPTRNEPSLALKVRFTTLGASAEYPSMMANFWFGNRPAMLSTPGEKEKPMPKM